MGQLVTEVWKGPGWVEGMTDYELDLHEMDDFHSDGWVKSYPSPRSYAKAQNAS